MISSNMIMIIIIISSSSSSSRSGHTISKVTGCLLSLPLFIASSAFRLVVKFDRQNEKVAENAELPDTSCDSHTHTPAKKSSTDFRLYPFLLRKCYTKQLSLETCYTTQLSPYYFIQTYCYSRKLSWAWAWV